MLVYESIMTRNEHAHVQIRSIVKIFKVDGLCNK